MTLEARTYSQSELEQKALDFLKQNKKKAIKGMSREELQEWATQKAESAQSYHDSLVKTGVWEEEAWNRAIRLEILESESD